MFRRFFLFFSFIFLLFPSIVSAGYHDRITSPFGWRIHPVSGEWKFHSGTDFGYEYGTPIYSLRKGVVVYAAEYGGYGICIIVQHDNGDRVLYGHCSALAAGYGQEVEQGEVIAYVGSTGISTGPHLHLEIHRDGYYVDPIDYLDNFADLDK